MCERVDSASDVQQGRLRRRPPQHDLVQPLAVPVSPCVSVIEPDPVAQKELREAVTAAHQIDPYLFPGTDQVPQRFLLRPRHPDRMKLPREQQPDDQLRVAAIGLHAIPRRARDLRRRRDDTLHAPLDQLAREPVPRRTGLIRDPDRPRQRRAERGRPADIRGHREELQLARLSIQHRRDDLRRVHVQANEGSSLRHGWFLQYAVVGRRAVAAARHERHPTNSAGGPASSTPDTGRTLNPYCLGKAALGLA